MTYILFALFIGVPILEISVFISVGEEIGLNWTLVIVILTAVVGTWMIKRQGLKTLYRLQDQLDRGQLPVREVFDAFFLLLAGALLLIPGFVTDGVGFLLLMSPFRSLLQANIGRLVSARRHSYEPRARDMGDFHEPFSKDVERNVHGPVIDGEFKDLTGHDNTEKPKVAPDSVVRRIDK
ncbi:MAG: hypothetical protein CMM45_06885 [Rhodospirillaceae bacterium]|nr:hypothetical protein [Rhodospirillaceae bacterium]